MFRAIFHRLTKHTEHTEFTKKVGQIKRITDWVIRILGSFDFLLCFPGLLVSGRGDVSCCSQCPSGSSR